MIYYITTHEKNKQAASLIKKQFDQAAVSYAFVYGKESVEPLEPFIRVDCEESYENLPLKTFLLIEHFLKSGNERMVKLDDDTLVDVPKLAQLLKTEDYIGMFTVQDDTVKNTMYHWYKIKNNSFRVPKKIIKNVPYAHGACYCLSKKAAQIVYNKGRDFYVNTPSTYLGEDIKVGIALLDSDVTRKDITSNESLFYEIAKDFAIVHPVHSLLFEKIKNATNQEKQSILRKYEILNANKLRDSFLTDILSN